MFVLDYTGRSVTLMTVLATSQCSIKSGNRVSLQLSYSYYSYSNLNICSLIPVKLCNVFVV